MLNLLPPLLSSADVAALSALTLSNAAFLNSEVRLAKKNPTALCADSQTNEDTLYPAINAKDDTLAGDLTISLFCILGISKKTSQHATLSRHILYKAVTDSTYFY